MELICGVPKPPKSVKYDNWGTWGRMGFTSASSGNPFPSRSSTMPSGNRKSSPFRQHLIPSPVLSRQSVPCETNPYKTLFKIPQSKGEVKKEGEEESSSAVQFRRTKTLPASAIRRSGVAKGKKIPDKSDVIPENCSFEPTTLRSLRDKFRLESFRRYNKGKTSQRGNSLNEYDQPLQNIYTIPKNILNTNLNGENESLPTFRRNLSMPPVNVSEAKSTGQVLRIPDFSINSDDIHHEEILEEKQIRNQNGDHYQEPFVKSPPSLMDTETASSCPDTEFPEFHSHITDDLLTDILKMGNFSSKLIENSPDSSYDLCSHPYSELQPPKNDGFKSDCSEGGERNSLVSSDSVGSRLTFGTSTDEGIGSIYSETYSNLWSSSASSDASNCSTISADTSNIYTATDEGMSVCSYGGMSSSSSYASSFSSVSQCHSKGAIPKSRSMSFRHRPRDPNFKRKGVVNSCGCSAETACTLCKDIDEEGVSFKRTASLRAPKQLPVTPTLLRLLQLGLEQVGGVCPDSALNCDVSSSASVNGVGGVTRREKVHPPRTDAHRLSRANLEESGDLELDAILNELCALETKFNRELSPSPGPTLASETVTPVSSENVGRPESEDVRRTMPSEVLSLGTRGHATDVSKMGSDVNLQKLEPRNVSLPVYKTKFDHTINADAENGPGTTLVSRTDSPDNDSAFSDNVSMLSSESSASSGASAGGVVSSKQPPNRHLIGDDSAAKAKAEKIKMALEKLKEANVKKLFIKAFGSDGSSKSLLVDEKMAVSHVCRTLMDKNHVRVDPKWALVEHLPDLHMERIYEDDEKLVDNLLLWTRDSKNRLLFLDRQDKYDLFLRPENYLLYGASPAADVDEETRAGLIEEFFSSSRAPEVEGPLFLKSEGKKAWKKFYFVLRQSGLYYCPKGKSSRSSKDLVCLATLENNQVYHGVGWKKKFKAPTDWCFAIKFPHLQAKSSKHIKYLCSESPEILKQWVMGIRVAKNGHRLLKNYRALVEEVAQEDIDLLASSRRSFSLASVGASSEATTPSSESRSLDSCLAPSLAPSLPEEDSEDACSSAGSSSQDTPVNTLGRVPAWRQDSFRSNSSSSSSGCMSERSSSTGTPPAEGGFEADYPQQGTIKRKPSSAPKIPLTSTTRHLVKEVDLESELGSRAGSLRRSARKSLSEEVSTLRRKNAASSSTLGRASVPTVSVSSTLLRGANVVQEEFVGPTSTDSGICDAEHLPPPPPELLQSTLSLNSLPPPPDEASLPAPSSEDLMSASITSLPPPPPPQTLPKPVKVNIKHPLSPPATPPKPKMIFPLHPTGSPPPPPAVVPKPHRDSNEPVYVTRVSNLPLENSSTNGPSDVEKQTRVVPSSLPLERPVLSLNQPANLSSVKRVKKITFQEEVENIPISPCPSPVSSPTKIPPVPKRLQTTRLSANPGKLTATGCKVTPPKSFLSNLQKVMQKKWQVAQKCRDFDKTPHEVLGFRDPVSQVEAEKNVGAWIQEHYGSLYENLAPTSPPPLDSPDGPACPTGPIYARNSLDAPACPTGPIYARNSPDDSTCPTGSIYARNSLDAPGCPTGPIYARNSLDAPGCPTGPIYARNSLDAPGCPTGPIYARTDVTVSSLETTSYPNGHLEHRPSVVLPSNGSLKKRRPPPPPPKRSETTQLSTRT